MSRMHKVIGEVEVSKEVLIALYKVHQGKQVKNMMVCGDVQIAMLKNGNKDEAKWIADHQQYYIAVLMLYTNVAANPNYFENV